MDRAALAKSILAWQTRFGAALGRWEEWLLQVEEAYLAGRFESLQAIEGEGNQIHEELAECKRQRGELLAAAREQPMLANSMTQLAELLAREIPAVHRSELQAFASRLRRVQQLSAALWVTAFRAAGYTAAVLEILATGSPNRATYAPGERTALEGGHLVDAAA
jgi:hypothetical protein